LIGWLSRAGASAICTVVHTANVATNSRHATAIGKGIAPSDQLWRIVRCSCQKVAGKSGAFGTVPLLPTSAKADIQVDRDRTWHVPTDRIAEQAMSRQKLRHAGRP